MVFSSTIFLTVFFPCLFIFYYNPFFKSRKFKNALLLLASLVFYACGESLFVFIMLLSILLNYFLAILIEHFEKKKLFLTISVLWNVALLFVFKYLAFTEKELIRFFNLFSIHLNIPVIEIALPIGISFFTFQIMSYVFDVYYGKVRAQKNFFDLSLYISFFPQLIAGPIVRYESIENQIQNRIESKGFVFEGMERFILGLAKKCLLANYLAIVADGVFNSSLDKVSTGIAWLGAIFYTLQIYFDFSGYSDMAIGLGKIFGFEFEENFNYPYMASSVTDFWRRWHISLSSWFKNYVYIPLGGSRCSKQRNILNLFVVWCLTGIWHGAALTFWFWGIYYFVLLIFERKFVLTKLSTDKKLFKIFWRLCTLLFVVLSLVLFRSPSLKHALGFTKKMFSFDFTNFKGEISNFIPLLIASVVCCFPIWPKYSGKIPSILKNLFLIFIFLWSLLTCVSSEYSPFIYFNF